MPKRKSSRRKVTRDTKNSKTVLSAIGKLYGSLGAEKVSGTQQHSDIADKVFGEQGKEVDSRIKYYVIVRLGKERDRHSKGRENPTTIEEFIQIKRGDRTKEDFLAGKNRVWQRKTY